MKRGKTYKIGTTVKALAPDGSWIKARITEIDASVSLFRVQAVGSSINWWVMDRDLDGEPTTIHGLKHLRPDLYW